jgi:hypothetical protein
MLSGPTPVTALCRSLVDKMVKFRIECGRPDGSTDTGVVAGPFIKEFACLRTSKIASKSAIAESSFPEKDMTRTPTARVERKVWCGVWPECPGQVRLDIGPSGTIQGCPEPQSMVSSLARREVQLSWIRVQALPTTRLSCST